MQAGGQRFEPAHLHQVPERGRLQDFPIERKKSGPVAAGTESRKKLLAGKGAAWEQSLFSLSNRKTEKGLIAQLVRARA